MANTKTTANKEQTRLMSYASIPVFEQGDKQKQDEKPKTREKAKVNPKNPTPA